jgi:gamma-glutamyltranspeptidase/glutathione hydrolase
MQLTKNMHIQPNSYRSPIRGDNIVATSQPLAAQAGLAVMNKGGNAVDAAIATAITLTVVEPTMNGIGSDAFCLVWDGQRLHGLNGAGKFPAKWTYEHYKKYSEMPISGWGSVTVPGAVSSWVELSRRFGRLAFEELFEPAVRYATDGFLVSNIISDQWAGQVNRFKEFEEFNRVFTNNGLTPTPGDRVSLPDHADTLTKIASSNGQAFYQGALAELMVEDSDKHNGQLSIYDLGDHSVDWVSPISGSQKEFELHEIPPSGQGLAALIAVGILNCLEDTTKSLSRLTRLHFEIESMKLALREAYSEFSDPSFMKKSVEELLSDTYHRRLAAKISINKALQLPLTHQIVSDTVYLTTADTNGMMVSFIQSNYMGFGSGVVVPNTGISLQNRAAGFCLDHKHPNCVAGDKKPFHTIIPGFITRDKKPFSSFGVMGGDMQAQGHLQLYRKLVNGERDPQNIINAPRWKLNKDGTLLLEETFGNDILISLETLGHRLKKMPYGSYEFGAAQMIIRSAHGYVAGSEPRRDGQAVGN